MKPPYYLCIAHETGAYNGMTLEQTGYDMNVQSFRCKSIAQIYADDAIQIRYNMYYMAAYAAALGLIINYA